MRITDYDRNLPEAQARARCPKSPTGFHQVRINENGTVGRCQYQCGYTVAYRYPTWDDYVATFGRLKQITLEH